MAAYDAQMVVYFTESHADLKALFDACQTRQEVNALARRLKKQLDGTMPEEVKLSWGAFEAFKAEANARTRVETIRTVSAQDMRVNMADRYLSRRNTVGRLR